MKGSGRRGAGAEDAEIVEVLDHHRLGGGLKSTQPIRFVNEPVGSTCTLVARQFRAAGIEPAPGIALCMASGIISDTLFLRSPTTTDVDREVLEWLRGRCQVDLEQYAREFFEIGSALRSSTPAGVNSASNRQRMPASMARLKVPVPPICAIGIATIMQSPAR